MGSTVCILTFSQEGATASSALFIAEGLRQEDLTVTIQPISDWEESAVFEADIIGIGVPCYFFRPPLSVMKIIRSFPRFDGKSFFTFVLYGTHVGKTGNWIRKEMGKRGVRELGYLKTFGSDKFYGYMRCGTLFMPDCPDEEDRKCCTDFGRTVGKRWKDKDSSFPVEPKERTPLLFAFERALVAPFIVKRVYSRTFKAGGRCNGCGACVKICPLNNISLAENKTSVFFGTNCNLCVKCEQYCPQSAITSVADWLIMRPFFYINVARGKREKIPYADLGNSWKK